MSDTSKSNPVSSSSSNNAAASSSAPELIPVTLWLTFEQITAYYDGISKDFPPASKEVQAALKSPEEFKKKSEDKSTQLQLSEAFLVQNQQMRNLLNQSVTSLLAFQKNYEKDKKKIEKLKKQIKDGRKDKKSTKSATIGSVSQTEREVTSSSSYSGHRDEDDKKEHKKSSHRRQKSVDSSTSRRLSSKKTDSISKLH